MDLTKLKTIVRRRVSPVGWALDCEVVDPASILHCASPRAHTIATSKVAMIFTGAKNEVIMAPFVVLMLLPAILITLLG